MTELFELYCNDQNAFIKTIVNMSNDLLLAELEDTVDFDIAQQISLTTLNPSEIISNLSSDSHVFYRKQKCVFNAIKEELRRRLNNIPVNEYLPYIKFELE